MSEQDTFDEILDSLSSVFVEFEKRDNKNRVVRFFRLVKADSFDETLGRIEDGVSEQPTASPWAGNKIGVCYPLVGRGVMTPIMPGVNLITSTVWKGNESMPPTNDKLDFVERFPSHTQRVVDKRGQYLIHSRSFTITVKDVPAETDGRETFPVNDGEIVIEAANGSKITMDLAGNISIVAAAGAKVRLGSDTTTPIQEAVLRAKDISNLQLVPYMNANMIVTTPPVFFGSKKVECSD